MDKTTTRILTDEQTVKVFALITLVESMCYAISEVEQVEKQVAAKDRRIKFAAKLRTAQLKKACYELMKELNPKLDLESEEFLSDKASLMYLIAIGIGVIPNEKIEEFSEDFDKIVEKY